MTQALIGIIGGSGLYRMEALQNARQLDLVTPYGAPSSPLTWSAALSELCCCLYAPGI